MTYTFDTETHPIGGAMPAPPIVCLQWALDDGPPQITVGREAIGQQWRAMLASGAKLVGHNAFFDLGVLTVAYPDTLADVFAAVEDGRVRCTAIRQRLLDIGRPEISDQSVSMASVLRREHGVDVGHLKSGEDVWRLRYAELDGVPLADWPREARDYAESDITHTRLIYQAQPAEVSPDELLQTRAYWGLQLMSIWGMVTDPVAVATARAELEQRIRNAADLCVEAGLIRIEVTKRLDHDRLEAAAPPDAIRTPGGKLSMAAKALAKLAPLSPEWAALAELKAGGGADAERMLIAAGWLVVTEREVEDRAAVQAAVSGALGADAPLTDHKHKPQVKTDRDTLQQVAAITNDPALAALSTRKTAAKYLSTYIEPMERGVLHPGYFLVDSGRTSARGPNIQNWPRKGGLRECIVPRHGLVFLQADYTQIEMVCFARLLDDATRTKSSLTRALWAGMDCHLIVAAQLLGLPYEEAKRRYEAGDPEVANRRQLAKVANYGFAGGMGAAAFVDYCRGYGVYITRQQADEVRAAWHRAWPEAATYFAGVAELVGDGGSVCLVQRPSGRRRAVSGYAMAANSAFQGMAADGAKSAIWQVARACYLDPTSPLFGWRPCAFIHDELLVEGHPDNAGAALAELKRVMVEAMKATIDDGAYGPWGYPVAADGKVMQRWSK